MRCREFSRSSKTCGCCWSAAGRTSLSCARRWRGSGSTDKVVFTGRVPHGDVHRYYSIVDICAYPRHSMRLTELVTPLKPLEAMAQGRLLVASDVGGHRELIRDGETGVLFRAGDAGSLADAILRLHGTARALASAAHQRAALRGDRAHLGAQRRRLWRRVRRNHQPGDRSMRWQGLRIGLVGPLPPPAGGMATQTRQLAELLAGEGVAVTLVQVNAPYSPAWVGGLKGARAVFRLVPYLLRLWRCVGDVQLVHVMANSGWSWHLFAAPAVWIARARGVPVVVNYRGGEAASFPRTLGALGAAQPRCGQPCWRCRRISCARSSVATASRRGAAQHRRSDPFSLRGPPPERRTASCRDAQPRGDLRHPDGDARVRARAGRLPGSAVIRGGERTRAARVSRRSPRSLGIAGSVSFPGAARPRSDRGALSRGRLMLNPSRVDNMPNSVLEALACGLPVVSTRVGGVPYHRSRRGQRAAGGRRATRRRWLRRSCACCAMPNSRRRLATAGFADVQQYTWARVRVRLAELYERVLPAGDVRSDDGVGNPPCPDFPRPRPPRRLSVAGARAGATHVRLSGRAGAQPMAFARGHRRSPARQVAAPAAHGARPLSLARAAVRGNAVWPTYWSKGDVDVGRSSTAAHDDQAGRARERRGDALARCARWRLPLQHRRLQRPAADLPLRPLAPGVGRRGADARAALVGRRRRATARSICGARRSSWPRPTGSRRFATACSISWC